MARLLKSFFSKTTGLLDPQSELFRNALQKLRQLCGRSNQLPTECYLSSSIRLEVKHAVSQGGFSDVYCGVMSGRQVALKALRIHVDDQARVNKVC